MKLTLLAGWLLLIIGLFVIGYALFSSFQIFTGQKEAYPLFSSEEEEKSLPKSGFSLEEQMSEVVREQISGLIPVDSFPRLLDLIGWSVLASIFILGGGKIAGLGIQLIKNREK
jgi:hypothetical protein